MGETSNWFVYMVRCNDDSLYTGITTDVARRVNEHNGLSGNNTAAKYTRVRQPVVLVYTEQAESRSKASQREVAIKRLSKKAKEILVS